MAKLDDLLQTMITDIEGAIGCAVVDLNSGLLLGEAHNAHFFTSSYLEAVAAASVDMVRGKSVRAVESLLANQRGKSVTKSIKEVQITTDETHQFMATLHDKSDYMVLLITNKSTNLGMGWASVRANLGHVAAMCP